MQPSDHRQYENTWRTERALFESPEFTLLLEKLKAAKEAGKTISCFMGAHVIKCGLSRYIVWLMENGCITHLASNGAGSIHDFELAYLGGTSEHVPTAIDDGSFGMWEQTGRWMNEAIIEGAKTDTAMVRLYTTTSTNTNQNSQI